MKPSLHRQDGFTSLELLLVVALSAVVISGAVISYGTLVRSQPSVSSVVMVPLGQAATFARWTFL